MLRRADLPRTLVVSMSAERPSPSATTSAHAPRNLAGIALTFVGGLIVVLSGLHLIHRERIRQKFPSSDVSV